MEKAKEDGCEEEDEKNEGLNEIIQILIDVRTQKPKYSMDCDEIPGAPPPYHTSDSFFSRMMAMNLPRTDENVYGYMLKEYECSECKKINLLTRTCCHDAK